MQLRPYQTESEIEICKELDLGGNPLLKLSTGAGKTIVAKAVIDRYIKDGRRVLFLAHRIELLRQGGEAIGLHPNLSIQSVQGHKYAGPVDLIVTDEAHHAVAESYQAIYRQYPGIPNFGMTATPVRGDGRGLGTKFTKLISVTTTKKLIEQKYLAPIEVFVPENTIDATGVKKTAGKYQSKSLSKVAATDSHCMKAIEEYKAKADGLRGLVFCVDRAHSRKMAAYYCAAGYKAIHLDGATKKDDRAKAIEAYRAGEVDIITNCNLFKEGLDLPVVDFVQCLVNTTSLVDYWQMIGRGMRPGDKPLVFLDHTNNWRTIGLPDDDSITFSLDGGAAKEKTGKKYDRREDGAIVLVDGDDDEWVGGPSSLVALNPADRFYAEVLSKGETTIGVYAGSLTKVEVECKNGHLFMIRPNDYKSGSGCRKCAGKCPEQAKENFYALLKTNGETSQSPYAGSMTKVEIKCKNGHRFMMTPKSYKQGSSCPKCAGKCPEQAKENFYALLKTNGETAQSPYVNAKTKMGIKCKSGHLFMMNPGQYKSGRGCNECHLNKRFPNRAPTSLNTIGNQLVNTSGFSIAPANVSI